MKEVKFSGYGDISVGIKSYPDGLFVLIRLIDDDDKVVTDQLPLEDFRKLVAILEDAAVNGTF